jgi:hypothetical protein
MISILLSCLLPLTTCADADASGPARIGTVAVGHPASYYDHREHERKERMDHIQAEREKEHGLRMDYEKESSRQPGSIYLWKDSPKQHEAKRQRLQDQEQKHELARQAQEQVVRDEAVQDRRERGLPDGADL